MSRNVEMQLTEHVMVCPIYRVAGATVYAQTAVTLDACWRVGKNRVLRLMRAHRLLAPQCAGHPHGDPAHAGTITTERPNVRWGTDALLHRARGLVLVLRRDRPRERRHRRLARRKARRPLGPTLEPIN
jgi:hypothetical protein